MKFVFSPDGILCGWLGSKPYVASLLICQSWTKVSLSELYVINNDFISGKRVWGIRKRMRACVCVCVCMWHAYLLCKRPGISWDRAPLITYYYYYSFHKSSYHKLRFLNLLILRGHSTREPASSRVTYFILRPAQELVSATANVGKNRERFWKKCRWMDRMGRNKQGRNSWQ